MVRWDSEYAQIELQANEFAVALLMPLDDFRSQIDSKAKPTLDDIGQCAQSHLAKAPILLRRLDRRSSFEIIVRRSFADYFWLWLEDAAAEYSLAVSA